MRRFILVCVAFAMLITAGIGANLALATEPSFLVQASNGSRDCSGSAQVTVTVTGDSSPLVVNGAGFPALGVDVTGISVSGSASPYTVKFTVPDSVPKNTAVSGFMSVTVGTHTVNDLGFTLPAIDCTTPPPTTPPATNPPSAPPSEPEQPPAPRPTPVRSVTKTS
jgi:hypothetical protein